jgi:Arc/MetJ family transcription regulator
MHIQRGVSTASSRASLMRINIEIDDALLSQAMTATGLPTKRATVEEGLRMLVRMRKQAEAFADLNGLGWEGDLDAMRQACSPGKP